MLLARQRGNPTRPPSTPVDPTVEDNRNCCSRCFGGECRRCGHRRDYSYLTANEIGCKRRQSIVFTRRPAIFDCNVLALDKAGFAQSLAKTDEQGRVRIGLPTVEEPNYRHLLRPRRKRQCSGRRRAAEQGYQLAPS